MGCFGGGFFCFNLHFVNKTPATSYMWLKVACSLAITLYCSRLQQHIYSFTHTQKQTQTHTVRYRLLSDPIADVAVLQTKLLRTLHYLTWGVWSYKILTRELLSPTFPCLCAFRSWFKVSIYFIDFDHSSTFCMPKTRCAEACCLLLNRLMTSQRWREGGSRATWLMVMINSHGKCYETFTARIIKGNK